MKLNDRSRRIPLIGVPSLQLLTGTLPFQNLYHALKINIRRLIDLLRGITRLAVHAPPHRRGVLGKRCRVIWRERGNVKREIYRFMGAERSKKKGSVKKER